MGEYIYAFVLSEGTPWTKQVSFFALNKAIEAYIKELPELKAEHTLNYY